MFQSALSSNLFGFCVLVIAIWLGRLVLNIWSTLSQTSRPELPVVAISEGQLFSDEVTKAMNQYPDGPFELKLGGSSAVILPYNQVEAIKNLPESIISFKERIYEVTEARYTGSRDTEDEGIDVIKGELTRNITIIDDLQEEIKYILGQQIKATNTWTQINVHETVDEIVAGMTARIFVGLPLCRDREWVDATKKFPRDVIASILELQSWHPLLRSIVSLLSSKLRTLQEYRKFAARRLDTYVEARKHNMGSDPNAMNWILDHYKVPSSVSAWRLGVMYMNLVTATIDTLGLTLQNIFIDLASFSQYIPELRAEIESVLQEDSHGQLHRNSIPKLKKLDSFIKESQRLNPPLPINITRKVTAKDGLELPTGQVLPYGTHIGVPHPYAPGSTVHANKLYSAKDQPSFHDFAPWRYFNLRKLPGEESKHQFITISADSPIFGVGPQACPGRFFATDVIKVALVEFLKRYDFALGANGESAAQGLKRPAAIPDRFSTVVDPNTTVYIHERKME